MSNAEPEEIIYIYDDGDGEKLGGRFVLFAYDFDYRADPIGNIDMTTDILADAISKAQDIATLYSDVELFDTKGGLRRIDIDKTAERLGLIKKSSS